MYSKNFHLIFPGIVRQQKIEIQPPSPPVRKKSTTLNPPTTVKKDSLDSVTTATVPTTGWYNIFYLHII